MTATISRAEQLRNDLENMQFSRKYLIGVLAELEQLGRTHTAEFKTAEANIRVLKNNIKRVEEELKNVEEDEYMDSLYKRFIDEVDLHPWNE